MDECATKTSLYSLYAMQDGASHSQEVKVKKKNVNVAEKPQDSGVKRPAKDEPSLLVVNEQVEQKKQDESGKLIPKDATVITPYGNGNVLESVLVKEDDGRQRITYVVDLKWGKGYLNEVSCTWKKKLHEMSSMERLTMALEYKQHGNEKFKVGDLKSAIHNYKLSLLYARQVDDETTKTQEVNKNVILPCHQNTAICCIRIGDLAEAIANANDALFLNPKSIKALFYRARANRMRGEFAESKKDLNLALSIDRTNKDVRNELQLLIEAIKTSKDSEKEMFAGVLSKKVTQPKENEPNDPVTPHDEEELEQEQQKEVPSTTGILATTDNNKNKLLLGVAVASCVAMIGAYVIVKKK